MMLIEMTPGNTSIPQRVISKGDKCSNYDTHLKLPSQIGTDYGFKRKIVWFNALGFVALHLAALYGYYLCLHARFFTVVWMLALVLVSGLGVTIGAHRMYSHKAFKGAWPLRLALIMLHTLAGQNCMYIWVRDHRQHHKYSDTDADPHNANRGFFFSHIGWLMCKKHPAVISKGKTIDLSDLEADSLVMFQKTFYKSLYAIFAMALPIAAPIYFWNETYLNSLFISYFARYIMVLHFTWLVNSAAHLYGTRPYDETLKPVECYLIKWISAGEGWHNYHHAFPWDYRAAEFGSHYSLTTFVINILAAVGLAYDLKVAPYTMVQHRTLRAGDGTHHIFGKEAQITHGDIPYTQTPDVDEGYFGDLKDNSNRSLTIKG
ncbi:acyl-CoA desaturase-like isoform X2 [Photinus pyralis]|uniref:acyl-CoA desaturase-like isoform X2 n=1 Tax=Photinus pyralis TaxID=7054 RepID=UPI00126759D0|nr:acyl-CoA desaturase-like isoform X2 [Photinus pyralis]